MHCCKYFLPDIINVVMNSLSCMFYLLTFAIIILPKSFYAVCLSCVYLTRIVLHLFLVSFKYWNPSFSIVFPYGHWRLENHCILRHHENTVKWLQNHLKILKFDLCEHHLRLMVWNIFLWIAMEKTSSWYFFWDVEQNQSKCGLFI